MPNFPNKNNFLYQWYAVKPLARRLFCQYQFEIYWIKNAWIYFHKGIQDEKLKNEMTITDPEDEISEEIKVWLIALYKLYHVFKKILDLEYSDYIDVNEVADNIDFDIVSYYRMKLRRQDRDKEWSDEEIDDFIWEDLRAKEKVFCEIIERKFNNNTSEIAGFFCNSGEVLDLVSYIKTNEDKCNSVDDFIEIEGKKYPEYQHKIEVTPSIDSNDLNFRDAGTDGIVSGKTMKVWHWIEDGFSY